MSYNYKDGKNRIKEILNNQLEIIEVKRIPSDDDFTFENAYYGWVSAIFIDLRDSSTLFSDGDKTKVSKIIRSFTSEVIEILKENNMHREIGIRGDCVYAIYPTPSPENEVNLFMRCCFINTLLKMLNQLFTNKGFPQIEAGIGLATAQELVVKAGRRGADINNKVWIGDAVTKASNLSSLGNKKLIDPIVLSEQSYSYIIELATEANQNAPNWFKREYDYNNGIYYHCNTIMEEFDNWVDGGMKDD